MDYLSERFGPVVDNRPDDERPLYRYLSLRGFNDVTHDPQQVDLDPAAELPPYWDQPLDYTAPLALEAMLPRLWPVSTPDDEIRPDLSGDIACRLAGLRYRDACPDRADEVPWSADDLLLHRYENIHLDEHFLDWVDDAWPH